MTAPALRELLIDSDRLADPEGIAQAADAALYPIPESISAIGDLLWAAATNSDYEISRSTLAGIGLLLSHLGTFQDEVREIESNASFQAYDIRSDKNSPKPKAA